ncbi:MAG: VOC family protein [Myxococcota bacterium]
MSDALRLPDGFGQVAPYIFVEDGVAYMDYLCESLGGTITNRKVDGEGKLLNGHVHFGHGSIMVTEARPPDYPAGRVATYLFVADCDAVFERAVAAGMETIYPPADMPYKDRQAGVRDARGNIWWISQRLVAGPY